VPTNLEIDEGIFTVHEGYMFPESCTTRDPNPLSKASRKSSFKQVLMVVVHQI